MKIYGLQYFPSIHFLYDGNIAKFEALIYSRASLQIAKYLLSLNSREPILKIILEEVGNKMQSPEASKSQLNSGVCLWLRDFPHF